MSPPCMACVVRDNPHGTAPPDFAYVVALVDATGVGPAALIAALCEAHRREYDEICAMDAAIRAAARTAGALS